MSRFCHRCGHECAPSDYTCPACHAVINGGMPAATAKAPPRAVIDEFGHIIPGKWTTVAARTSVGLRDTFAFVPDEPSVVQLKRQQAWDKEKAR